MKGLSLIFFLSLTATGFSQKADFNFKSVLTNANVFYGYGAELNHTAKAQLQNGSQEITIQNISNSVQQNTVQISVPDNVILLSYRFNQKQIRTAVSNPSIKKMEDSVKLLQKQLASVANEIFVTEDMLNKTAKLIEAYSSSQNKTMTAGELIKLLDFYTGKVQSYRGVLYNLAQKKTEINEQINEINSRLYIAQNENGNEVKHTGEMILQVMAQQMITADFGVSYFTQSAGWIPTYDLKVKSIDNSFKLGYKALVHQNTGLDWKQVKLTLSTNNPNQGQSIPVLNPQFLQVYVPAVYKEMRGRAAAANYNRAQSLDKYALSETKTSAYAVQEEAKDDISDYLTLNESQLNTSFEIDLPYDIPSDGKSYSVAIKEENIKASYKHYSIPKIDKDAFLIAEVSDWEDLSLLPGDANIIMDNIYLGKSFIDPNTTMDSLNLSMGRDRRVAMKRILVKEFCKTKVKGDTKTENFLYEITVKNNKKSEVSMLLKDQYPISNMKEVEVTLDETSEAEINADLGTLNWKVVLKPGESKKFRFGYTVKYPKDKVIANLR